MDARYRIRPAVRGDAPALAALERRCFGDPWSESAFREALESPWGSGVVAEGPRGVVGYLVAREAGGSGEVLNLAVAPEARRRGVGRALLEAGIDAMAAHGVDEVYLEVRESNRSAQALYLGYGFRPVGQRRAYYRNPREDAVVLRLTLADPRGNGNGGVTLVD
jgi:ribosomal-protein-alanine N-acetyltransferase